MAMASGTATSEMLIATRPIRTARLDLRCGTSARSWEARPHHQPVDATREPEPDEPRPVVDRPHRGPDRAEQRDPGAGERRHDRRDVPAVRVAIRAMGRIERREVELGAAEDPVVDDQHAGDRADRAGITDEPAVDVA